jgi:FtsP/CotA-like multicopper oxidase with cupredoxin domain
MSATTMKKATSMNRMFALAAMSAPLFAAMSYAAAPGITGTGTTAVFNLTAQTAGLNQPDGSALYSWGYGCATGSTPTFAPANMPGTCPTMQVPGPTLIVTEGQTVTVTLTNNLPAAAGNTSILFPGFQVKAAAAATQPSASCTTPLVQGLLTSEATNGCSVTYTFVAGSPGTRAYYSGTQSDLQIEMGLYGAVIVLPASVPAHCSAGLPDANPGANAKAQGQWGERDFRLAPAAFDHTDTCYDREYLFQFAELDPNIHKQAYAQVNDPVRISACTVTTTNGVASGGPGAPGCSLEVPVEPYHPAYFLINGRSMPDDMDTNYAAEYPHQPYNGNPHMHPGEQVLLRVIGQGHWQHPFHEHANHVRILARDGNLILSNLSIKYSSGDTAPALAGPLQFTTTTSPGIAFDGLFYYTGRGLNWDLYAHHGPLPAPAAGTSPNAVTYTTTANDELPCVPDLNGYNTGAPTAINYYEWCQDHNKPLEAHPFGDVAGGGPITLPDANILTNGAWFSGSPYLGPDATSRATGPNSVYQPFNTQANPSNERGFAFMWHSHNEREITTNNVFPGGMFMMMLVDSREFVIDESN